MHWRRSGHCTHAMTREPLSRYSETRFKQIVKRIILSTICLDHMITQHNQCYGTYDDITQHNQCYGTCDDITQHNQCYDTTNVGVIRRHCKKFTQNEMWEWRNVNKNEYETVPGPKDYVLGHALRARNTPLE